MKFINWSKESKFNVPKEREAKFWSVHPSFDNDREAKIRILSCDDNRIIEFHLLEDDVIHLYDRLKSIVADQK